MAKQPTPTSQDKPTPASRPVARGRSTTAAGTAGGLPARAQNAPNIVDFFKESRSELRKVTWPTRQETMNLTSAVIVMTVSIAIFLGVIDTALDFIVKPIIGAK